MGQAVYVICIPKYIDILKPQGPLQLIQLVAKKSGSENFPNVNLILSICQLIICLTIPLVRRFYTMEKL
jgi:hypothetical protein